MQAATKTACSQSIRLIDTAIANHFANLNSSVKLCAARVLQVLHASSPRARLMPPLRTRSGNYAVSSECATRILCTQIIRLTHDTTANWLANLLRLTTL